MGKSNTVTTGYRYFPTQESLLLELRALSAAVRANPKRYVSVRLF